MSTMTPDRIRDTVAKAYPFTVEKYRLTGPEGMRTPHFGLFRSDDLRCVGNSVREGYEPHTTEDVVACVEAASTAFEGEAEIQALWRSYGTTEGHAVIVSPTMETRKALIKDNDAVWPRLIVNGMYGSGFTAELGMYRDACRNMMMPRSVAHCKRTIRHTSSLPDFMQELVSDFTQLAARFDRFVEASHELAARQVQLDDFLSKLYPLAEDASDRSVEAARKRARSIYQQIGQDLRTTGSGGTPERCTLWDALNGVTGYVQHTKRRRKGEANKPVQRALSAMHDSEALAAWGLALQMAS